MYAKISIYEKLHVLYLLRHEWGITGKLYKILLLILGGMVDHSYARSQVTEIVINHSIVFHKMGLNFLIRSSVSSSIVTWLRSSISQLWTGISPDRLGVCTLKFACNGCSIWANVGAMRKCDYRAILCWESMQMYLFILSTAITVVLSNMYILLSRYQSWIAIIKRYLIGITIFEHFIHNINSFVWKHGLSNHWDEYG